MVELIGFMEAIQGINPVAQMGGLALDFVSKMVSFPLGMFFVLEGEKKYKLVTVKAEPILGASPRDIGTTYLECTEENDPFAALVNGYRRANLIDTVQLEKAPDFQGSKLEREFFKEFELGPLVMLAAWDQELGKRYFIMLARSRDETEFTDREKSFVRYMAPLLAQSWHNAIGMSGAVGPVPEPLAAELTSRELEIALMAARGAKNAEIAERLHIAPGTVKTHMHNIYAKLGIDSRVHLALGLGVSN